MHRVVVRLRYVPYLETRVPWKWHAACICGWNALSWQWIANDRPGGALPMALDHLFPTGEVSA